MQALTLDLDPVIFVTLVALGTIIGTVVALVGWHRRQLDQLVDQLPDLDLVAKNPDDTACPDCGDLWCPGAYVGNTCENQVTDLVNTVDVLVHRVDALTGRLDQLDSMTGDFVDRLAAVEGVDVDARLNVVGAHLAALDVITTVHRSRLDRLDPAGAPAAKGDPLPGQITIDDAVEDPAGADAKVPELGPFLIPRDVVLDLVSAAGAATLDDLAALVAARPSSCAGNVNVSFLGIDAARVFGPVLVDHALPSIAAKLADWCAGEVVEHRGELTFPPSADDVLAPF